jgi:hypothetical protein
LAAATSPATRAALAAGQIDRGKAYVIADELSGLSRPLAGRDLPPADVPAADQRLTALARRLKATGHHGALNQLRARLPPRRHRLRPRPHHPLRPRRPHLRMRPGTRALPLLCPDRNAAAALVAHGMIG